MVDDSWYNCSEYFNDNKLNTDSSNSETSSSNKCSDGCLDEDVYIVDGRHKVCKKCGIINGKIISLEPEWRSGNEDNNFDNSRCGMVSNELLPSSSLGSQLTNCKNYNIIKMQKWTSMPYSERKLWSVYEQLDDIGIKHNIPKDVILDSKIYYKIMCNQKHTHGKNAGKTVIHRAKKKIGLIGVCLFYACENNGLARTHKEIAPMFDINQKDITKAKKRFDELLSGTDHKNIIESTTNHIDDYILRYCSLMNLDPELIINIQNFTIMVDNLGILCESIPQSVVAGCIYFISQHYNLGITKKELSDIVKLSEVTIIKTYNKLYKFKDDLITKI